MTIRHTIALTAALTALTTAGIAQSTATVKRSLQALYNQEDAAAAKKDIPGMLADLSPDYKVSMKNGLTMNLAQMKIQAQQLMSMARTITNRTTVQKVTVKGGQALAAVKEHTVLLMMNPQSHKPAHVVVDSQTQDVWVKSKGAWKKSKSSGLTQVTTVDGKVMPQMR